MKLTHNAFALTLPLLMGLGAFAVQSCKSGGSGDGSGNGMANGMAAGMTAPFGGSEDMSRASSLWSSMSGYREWQAWPGLDGFQDGKSPHGRYLKYYVNGTAARNTANPRAGAVIVKENYAAPNDSELKAITVMKRIPGYDRENGDWFWVKFAPDGSVMKNPKGMSLAGRVAKGMNKGCIACHSNAGGGDFLFVNDD